MMQKATLGRTGLEVSKLTFGCGAVGGLMTKGRAADQDYAVAWARDNGINFFDTAASYGAGVSETNLGRALKGDTTGIVVSTKAGLQQRDLSDAANTIQRSIDDSLSRLKLDHVDLLQLHNTIGQEDRHGIIDVDQVLSEVIPAFDKIRTAGKARYFGFTAKGDVAQLHRLVESGTLDTAQIFYNVLVPSAGQVMPPNDTTEDYRQLLDVAGRHGVGAIGVRVLAGGALSGKEARHPHGMPVVVPIGSNTDYATDVQRALQFTPLIEAGIADSLPELALRFAISNQALPTTEIGIANIEQLQQAAAAVNRGPLSQESLDWISTIQRGLIN